MSLPQISEAEFEVMKIVSRDLFPKKLFPTKNKAGYLSILH